MSKLSLLVFGLTLIGCGKPDAKSVCLKLTEAGVASNCREVAPGGIGAAATARQDFDLVSLPGKGGSVMTFSDDQKFDATLKTYEGLANLVGPHRYGNRAVRVFVQMNAGASSEDASKTKAALAGL